VRGTPSEEAYSKIGSLALRISRVAEGGLDAAFAGGNSRDWDLAAAHLLLSEAGGVMTTLQGDGLVYNRSEVAHQVLVAAGHDRHQRLLQVFKQV
jgi:myo-inositol-1(or 4)-monophosphatase